MDELKIKDAKEICKSLKANKVIILAEYDNKLKAVSYGNTKPDCFLAGVICNELYKIMRNILIKEREGTL
jgi:hypothetical protein